MNIYTEKKLKGIVVSKILTNPDLVIHCSTEVLSSPSHEWELANIPLSRQRKRIKLWKSTSLADASIRIRYELSDTGTIECTLNHDANELRVYYPERMNENDLTSFLLGTVIGCALRRRQTLCLHASVVSIQGKGVVLMGAKRAGKSRVSTYQQRLQPKPSHTQATICAAVTAQCMQTSVCPCPWKTLPERSPKNEIESRTDAFTSRFFPHNQ